MVSNYRKAFTLVELLVVIAIIGILIGMLLPAVQQVREAARRINCMNNIRQDALALHNYASAFKDEFPPGNSELNSGFGNSFWVFLLPYMEQGNLFDQYDLNAGGWTGASGNPNREVLREIELPFLLCPSSSLPVFPVAYEQGPDERYQGSHGRAGQTGMLPCYTGISGSSEHVSQVSGDEGGINSEGGVLLASRTVSLGEITDGTSNTMAIGEHSGWMLNDEGEPVDMRADGNHGFNMGCSGTVSDRTSPQHRRFNLVTVRHEINVRSVFGAAGSAGNMGPNRPLHSDHPGGVNVALCDGSAHFLSDNTSLDVLFNLADRDDAQVTSIESN